MKNNKINFNLYKLSSSLGLIEKKFKRYYFYLDNIPNDKINQIFLRNLYYFYTINEKIKYNFEEIYIIKKFLRNKNLNKIIKKELKDDVKKKSIISFILLEHLLNLMNKYQIDTFDFEIQTLIDKDEQNIIDKVPDKYKNDVLEEFNTLNNQNIIENFVFRRMKRGFKRIGRKISRGSNQVIKKVSGGINVASSSLKKISRLTKQLKNITKKFNDAVNFGKNIIKSITGMFKKIFESLRNVLNKLKKIVNFITKLLYDFIKLLWKLMDMLYKLITKTIPFLIKKIFSFGKLLYIKTKKTGLFTLLIFFLINILFSKYWDLLLGDLEVQGFSVTDVLPEQFTVYPALLLCSFIFWTKTRELNKYQNKILNFITEIASSTFKVLFTDILGLPKKDKFFKYKGNNVIKKAKLFSLLIFKNLGKFTIRFLLLCITTKIIGKYMLKEVFKGVPTIRDIILFPIIIIRYIFIKSYYLIKNYII